jgi:hypothetical protein
MLNVGRGTQRVSRDNVQPDNTPEHYESLYQPKQKHPRCPQTQPSPVRRPTTTSFDQTPGLFSACYAESAEILVVQQGTDMLLCMPRSSPTVDHVCFGS